ncbi:FYVE and coiled-coil domain-containing protein 1-like [Limulus polyphemus]|uniref:FYVE and coiled-coil domain-containing protein 1-like n=1 Tax=Limulus polyphemus TaxID=6850 RepID=A0ABM1TDW2_LIMPO|nr:FYVE and coiled-coil domain-containing protein 1-like [Limulus polyphemus]
MHKCLADTIQHCCLNGAVTSDWYQERSILLQFDQSSELVSVLYDLHDVHFDLSPRGHDLDVSWPTFSRKIFGVSHPTSWRPPSRSTSISSLTSFVSQNDSVLTSSPYNEHPVDVCSIEQLKLELSRSEATKSELITQVEELTNKEENLQLTLARQQQKAEQERQHLLREVKNLKKHNIQITEELKQNCEEWSKKEQEFKQNCEEWNQKEQEFKEQKEQWNHKEQEFKLHCEEWNQKEQEFKLHCEECNQKEQEFKQHCEEWNQKEQEFKQHCEEWNQKELELKEQLTDARNLVNKYSQQVELLMVQQENKDKCTEKNYMDMKIQITNLEKEVLAMKQKSSEIEEELDKERALKQEFRETVSSLELEVESLEMKQKELTEDLDKQLKENEDKSNLLEQQSEKLKILAEKLQMKENTIQKFESAKNELSERVQSVLNSNDRMRNLMEEVGKDNTELKAQLASEKKKNRAKMHELENIERTKHELESDILSLKSKLKSTQELLEIKDDELIRSKSSVRELEVRLKCLSEQSTDTQVSSLVEKLSDVEEMNRKLRDDLKLLGIDLKRNIDGHLQEKMLLTQQISELEKQKKDLALELQNKNKNFSEKEGNLHKILQNAPYLESLVEEQENMIDKIHKSVTASLQKHQRLCRQLNIVLEVLHLKDIIEDNEGQSSLSSTISLKPFAVMEDRCLIPNDKMCDEKMLDDRFLPVIYTLKRTMAKLEFLVNRNDVLQQELEKSCNLNNKLITAVKEHQRKIRGVSYELDATENVVSGIKKEHGKLRTAEAILKYELQEKRKLVGKLRQQLQATREDWNRVRIKNCESETEWHSLREEFAKRHKQTSEESGFVEDSRNSDNSTPSTEVQTSDKEYLVSLSSSVGSASMTSPHSSLEADLSVPTSPVDGAIGGEELLPKDESGQTKSRLDVLEEQCQLLYVSLVQSSKRNEYLKEKLDAILGNSETESVPSVNSDTGCGTTKSEMVAIPDDPNLNIKENLPDISCSVLMIEQVVSGDEVDTKSETSVITDKASGIEQVFHQQNITLPETDEVSACNAEEKSPGLLYDDELPAVENYQEYIVINTRKNALQDLVRRLKSDKALHEAREADLKAQVELLQVSKKELEKKLELFEQEENAVSCKGSDFRKQAEFVFQQEVDSFKDKASVLGNERTQLNLKIADLEQQVLERDNTVEILNNKLKELNEELESVRGTLEHEVSTLRFQLSTEALKYEQTQKHYSEQETEILEMKKNMNSQEQLILSLEEALTGIKEEREIEKERQWEELEELSITLSTREEECITLNEEVRKLTKELDDEKETSEILRSKLEEQRAQNQDLVFRLETELVQLRGDNEVLKKKLIQLIKEKDALWKKAQQLSHLQRVQATDRWMADQEVPSCLGCKTVFSIIVRKHHCRLCGRIFCHGCVNNWMMTTASSRKARVCNECYIQHLQLESVVKRSSPSPCTVEDNEDDVNLSRSPSHSFVNSKPTCKLNTDTPNSSVSDIVSVTSLSLPASDEQQQLLYATKGHSLMRNGDEDNKSQNCVVEDPNGDFSVISDEEICRSLSASSPYNTFLEHSSESNPRC